MLRLITVVLTVNAHVARLSGELAAGPRTFTQEADDFLGGMPSGLTAPEGKRDTIRGKREMG